MLYALTFLVGVGIGFIIGIVATHFFNEFKDPF